MQTKKDRKEKASKRLSLLYTFVTFYNLNPFEPERMKSDTRVTKVYNGVTF